MVTCESWLFYFIGSSGLQEYFQPWKLVVQDQLFREHGLMNKLSGIGKIADVFRAVAIFGSSEGFQNSFLLCHHDSHKAQEKLR